MTPRRHAVWSWALYDWANSAFATTVLVAFFPVFFAQHWAREMSGNESTFWLGVASSVASFAVAVGSPLLGGIGDLSGAKKRLLGVMTALGVLATAALFFIDSWSWALVAFVTGQIGFFLGITLYDSLIVEVSDDASAHRVSSLGYALGYLGGGLLLVINVLMTTKPAWFGLAGAGEAVRWSFLSVALWWGLFSLPLFRHVPEARPETRLGPATAMASALRNLWAMVQRLRGERAILLFLLAYWFYIDGVHTMARMAVDFGVKLGFDPNALIKALIITQFVGLPATIAFGSLGTRWGPKRSLYVGIATYVGVTLWAFSLRSESQFYAMAAVIGLVQGSVQALSRSFFSTMIPREHAGEYFGVYNMLGKFAAVLGPLLVGIASIATGSSRASILAVLILLVVGGLLLWRVPSPTQTPSAQENPGDPDRG